MRTPIIAGNWKMNTTVAEAVALAQAMRDGLEATCGVEKVVCPPFVSLASVAEVLKGTSIKLGAQNCYHQPKGAFTGEISPLMLAPLCQYVILGHSERRTRLGESDELINQKVRSALAHGLSVILCVGESEEDRKAGRTADVVMNQIQWGLQDVPSLDMVVVAYEPLWAIGTRTPATGEAANQVAALARTVVRHLFGPQAAEGLRIQYGGSVTSANVGEFLGQPDIDGALVGGASLNPQEFVAIVAAAAQLSL